MIQKTKYTCCMNPKFETNTPNQKPSTVEQESGLKVQEKHLLVFQEPLDLQQCQTVSHHLRNTLDMRAIELYEDGGLMPKSVEERNSEVRVDYTQKGKQTVFAVSLLVSTKGEENYTINKDILIKENEEFMQQFGDMEGLEGFGFEEFSEQVLTTAQRAQVASSPILHKQLPV